jgi:hypothetical protein
MATPQDIINTTLNEYSSTLSNNIKKGNVLLAHLNKAGKIRTRTGVDQVELLLAKENPNAKWIDIGSVLPTEACEVTDKAIYKWKQFICTVTVTDAYVAMNAGKAKLIDFVTAQLSAQEQTVKNTVAKSIYNNNHTDNEKDLVGLGALISDDPTTGIVGGIDRSLEENAFWRNQSLSTDGTPEGLVNNMRTMALRTSIAGDSTSLIISGVNLYLDLEKYLGDRQVIINTQTGDTGFPSLKFQGIPVYYDSNCDANHMYFINDNHIHFTTLNGSNFKLLPSRKPSNQLVTIYIMDLVACLTMDNARVQGVIFRDLSPKPEVKTEPKVKAESIEKRK